MHYVWRKSSIERYVVFVDVQQRSVLFFVTVSISGTIHWQIIMACNRAPAKGGDDDFSIIFLFQVNCGFLLRVQSHFFEESK